MKNFFTGLLITIALFVMIGVLVTELRTINRVQLKTIEGLREQNHFLLRRNGKLQIENKTFRQALDSAKIIYK